ncbi:four helix bundle protein [Clostridium sp. C8]|uniref:four helix bundle protein n=1 Tax=Clostridium sp. C8 TaxID=1667357 RepID=UPI00062E40E1|nr:four helix bundle protein [Clostridium sp. C8]KLE14610.1 hypothetical protein AAT22_15885 [Clostridium sp. C8]
MVDSAIKSKSFDFASSIIKVYKHLVTDKKEFVLSKQLLRSGTSIGANVTEAFNGQSKRDFLSKMYIAFKEADESRYWIELLIDGEYLDVKNGEKILNQCREVCRILNSIIKTTKAGIK